MQKHDATRLHYDFRLEWKGVLKSWAVTRGPSINPEDKRLAVRTEDHPMAYGDFEGTIPKKQYGGGTVMLWDTGWWEPDNDPDEGLKEGKLKFHIHGQRMHGGWTLVRMKPRNGEKRENWLLIKEHDEDTGEDGESILTENLTSVKTGRSMEEIAAGEGEKKAHIWESDKVPPQTSRQARLPRKNPTLRASGNAPAKRPPSSSRNLQPSPPTHRPAATG